MWNGIDLTVVSTGVGVVAAVLAGGSKLWKTVEKDDPGLVKAIPHEAVVIADDVAKFVEGLGKSPFFAVEAENGKVEIQHVTGKLLSSHLATAAADAIASFGKDFSSMTQGEKGTAIEMVQSALKAFGQVTRAQAIDSLHAADARKAALQPTAQAATERSQALSAPTQPEQTSPVSDGQPETAAVS